MGMVLSLKKGTFVRMKIFLGQGGRIGGNLSHDIHEKCVIERKKNHSFSSTITHFI